MKKFSTKGSKQHRLFCLDLSEKKQFPASPKDLACERDFNRIQVAGSNPDVLEKELSVFEGMASCAINSIEATLSLSNENLDVVLNLISMFAVRLPAKRAAMEKAHVSVAKQKLAIYASAKVGQCIDGILVTEELKKTLKNFQSDVADNKLGLTVNIPTMNHIISEMHMIRALFPHLINKKWTLVKADENLSFITCDNPVSLRWNDHRINFPPGFAYPNTKVVFPLTKKLALIGDQSSHDKMIIVGADIVAGINTSIFLSATQRIYTPKLDFYFIDILKNKISNNLKDFWDMLNNYNKLNEDKE